MKLHFDTNQEYQIEAIRAVTDIFEGQPLSGGDFEFSLTETGALLSENCLGNKLTLTEEQISESENIKFYFKLPFWFRISTPIGTYNPDWAIVFKGEKKIYFVAETKSRGQEPRPSEKMKMDCGKAHFEQFDDVTFKGPISSVSELN